MRWCQSCVLPDTRPNLRIEEDGRCNACHAHETKKDIDWDARAKALHDVIGHAKSRATGYDCLIPVSGGKDSTWQTVKCLEYGLNPLAVTWKTPARTGIGRQNLENLVELGVDHIDYQINPAVEARFMLETFNKLGSTGIPMHLALFNIPLMIATRFKIPLVMWGENSAFEYGSSIDAHKGFRLDAEWLKTYGVTHGTTAEDWIGNGLSRNDLTAYFGPSEAEMSDAGVNAMFLGYYLPWDPEATHSVAKAHGFKSQQGVVRTGHYEFADIDDDFISLHHWLKWYKFGFTRTFDNLSLEIRNGRITRDGALEILRAQSDETPYKDIEKFCAFAKISIESFFAMAEKFRNPNIWNRDGSGRMHIKDFLFIDWKWS